MVGSCKLGYHKNLLLIDPENPDVFELAAEGEHQDMEARFLGKSVAKELGLEEGSLNDFGFYRENVSNQLVVKRSWKGEVDYDNSHHKLRSFIIKTFIQINDPSIGEGLEAEARVAAVKKHLDQIKSVWQFFKEKFPNWIMVDINGNPLEEVLAEEQKQN